MSEDIVKQYPTCEKWGNVHDKACDIIAFVEWAESEGHIEVKFNETSEQLMYKYFDIDAGLLEEERRALLNSI